MEGVDKLFMIEEQIEQKSSMKNESSTNFNGNIAIIGMNRIGYALYDSAKYFGNASENIVGFVNEYPEEKGTSSASFPKILGNLNKLEEIVKKNYISKLIIAIHPQDVNSIHNAIKTCEKVNTDYYLTSLTYGIDFTRVSKEIVQRLTSIPGPNIRFIFDFLLSFLSFFLLLPSWLLIALIIKLESSGSVLYSQERVGKDGKIFKMFKFRTFLLKKDNGFLSSISSNPEYTRFGRMLKKYRLEDLPKLLNVMLGDLSIIGPRPDEPYFHEKYSNEIPFYENRLNAKPGLVSLAQIETFGDNLIEDVREKLKYDLFYVDHQKSFLLNLKILLKSNVLIFGSRLR